MHPCSLMYSRSFVVPMLMHAHTLMTLATCIGMTARKKDTVQNYVPIKDSTNNYNSATSIFITSEDL